MDKIIKMMLVLIIKNQNKMINKLKLKNNNKIMINRLKLKNNNKIMINKLKLKKIKIKPLKKKLLLNKN